jgi:cytochrome P450
MTVPRSLVAHPLRHRAGPSLPHEASAPDAWQSLRFVLDPVGFFHSAQQHHGDVFTIGVLGQKWVVLAHPDAAREVFAYGPADLDSGKPNQVLRPLIGTHNLLLLDGEQHLHRRRIVLPAFHGEELDAYQEPIRSEVLDEIKTWPLGRPFAALPRMDALAFRLILRCVFGLGEEQRLGRLATVLLEMVRWMTDTRRQLFFFLLGPERLMRLPTFRRQLQRVDRAVYNEIAHRRASSNLSGRQDILSRLIRARDEDNNGLTDRELRDELITLLVAGHENTAATLSWAIHELARHPADQDRLTDEPGAYTDAVIAETLRLRPPVPVVVRRLRRPLTIAGHKLPAGTNICPCALLIHRHPDIYPQPLAFRPERFLAHRPAAGEWFPFGGSTRRCPGAAFAQQETRIALEEIAQVLRLTPVQRRSERTRPRSVVLVPARGARVVVARR